MRKKKTRKITIARSSKAKEFKVSSARESREIAVAALARAASANARASRASLEFHLCFIRVSCLRETASAPTLSVARKRTAARPRKKDSEIARRARPPPRLRPPFANLPRGEELLGTNCKVTGRTVLPGTIPVFHCLIFFFSKVIRDANLSRFTGYFKSS